MVRDDALELKTPIRTVRGPGRAAWVDAVLAGCEGAAAAIAGREDIHVYLTRSLDDARAALRRFSPGLRRAGLVRSSGAKRLRAEGIEAQLFGKEEPVSWFLERWPDVRSSAALEVCATEYSCQGLELDAVALCWGGDFLWHGKAWRCREWAAQRWKTIKDADTRDFIRNTYRVLLTRARYETVIWVPPGCARTDEWHDATRPAAEMDAIAAFLLACGARPLESAQAGVTARPAPPP